MKVNFKDLKIRPTLKGPEESLNYNLIAEAVYQNAMNLAEHKLAHRIADSDGEVELTEPEMNVIRRVISEWKFFAQKPILEALGDKFE